VNARFYDALTKEEEARIDSILEMGDIFEDDERMSDVLLIYLMY
jgi:hypothetical protein